MMHIDKSKYMACISLAACAFAVSCAASNISLVRDDYIPAKCILGKLDSTNNSSEIICNDSSLKDGMNLRSLTDYLKSGKKVYVYKNSENKPEFSINRANKVLQDLISNNVKIKTDDGSEVSGSYVVDKSEEINIFNNEDNALVVSISNQSFTVQAVKKSIGFEYSFIIH